MASNGTPKDTRRVIIDPTTTRRAPPPRPALPRGGDIRQTKEYKVAARRWVSTIVALPILMYTSYMLYERTYGGKSQRHLNRSGTGSIGNRDGSE